MSEQPIGQKVRKIRLSQDLSLNALAEITGLTKGYLSKIENADSPPPLSTLSKIALSLNIDVGTLISDEIDAPEGVRLCITREGSGKKLSSGSLKGYHYEILAHKKMGKNMEPILLYPSLDEEAEFSHEGEEFFYTIEGTHEFIYDGKSYILNKGDSVYFDSIVPHTGRSLNKKLAKILAISYSYKRYSILSNHYKVL